MRKIIPACFLCSLLIFPAVAQCREFPHRGLFVSVIQDPPVLSSRQDIKNLIRFARKGRIQVLFVQIYRANKAWFPSKMADTEPYETCFKNLSEDAFAFLIKEAHASGIQVHAWLNLMSLSANEEAPILKKYGNEILTQNLNEKKKLEDYKIDSQYFLEPGDTRVREELSIMVGEILYRYPDLDGVQFDYIRYPDSHPFYGYTPMNMERFKKETGRKTIEESDPLWKDWKRDQVTALLKLLVDKVRAVRPKIQISTTGCMPYSRAYHEAFQDWASWIKQGLVDFVTVMDYSADPLEYKKYILEAENKAGNLNKTNIAVGAYKLIQTPKTFKEEFDICESSQARACVVLHYGSLLENPALDAPLTGLRKDKNFN